MKLADLERHCSFVLSISLVACFLAVLSMRGRSSTRLAAHLVQKKQEDDFWSTADKSLAWYSMDLSHTVNTELQNKFVLMTEDAETQAFIQSSIAQSESWLTQSWYNLAKTVLNWFSYTHTDMNGILQRGSMFVLSTKQLQSLFDHAQVLLPPASVMIDLGAGDGKVTQKMAPFFTQIFATETSRPMQKLLKNYNITVLPVDQWMTRMKYDFIACLNLLDRCDRPIDIIKDMKEALNPRGLVLVAIVLPFKPFVEAKENYEPTQVLQITGETVMQQVESLVRIFEQNGFNLLAWTRLPYLCEGDMVHSVYYLDDIVFLLQL